MWSPLYIPDDPFISDPSSSNSSVTYEIELPEEGLLETIIYRNGPYGYYQDRHLSPLHSHPDPPTPLQFHIPTFQPNSPDSGYFESNDSHSFPSPEGFSDLKFDAPASLPEMVPEPIPLEDQLPEPVLPAPVAPVDPALKADFVIIPRTRKRRNYTHTLATVIPPRELKRDGVQSPGSTSSRGSSSSSSATLSSSSGGSSGTSPAQTPSPPEPLWDPECDLLLLPSPDRLTSMIQGLADKQF
ncbi:unnamed protein product, partial [Mesorhabditis spiculigera]